MRIWTGILVVILLGACQARVKEEATVQLEDVKLTDLSGKPIDFSQMKDKAILINFWATWCRPCLQEMPLLANAQRQMQDEPIVFLFASNETPERILAFKEKQQFDFQYVQVANLEALNVLALPTTFIFDRDGNLKFSEAGYRQWDSSESLQLLANMIKP